MCKILVSADSIRYLIYESVANRINTNLLKNSSKLLDNFVQEETLMLQNILQKSPILLSNISVKCSLLFKLLATHSILDSHYSSLFNSTGVRVMKHPSFVTSPILSCRYVFDGNTKMFLHTRAAIVMNLLIINHTLSFIIITVEVPPLMGF